MNCNQTLTQPSPSSSSTSLMSKSLPLLPSLTSTVPSMSSMQSMQSMPSITSMPSVSSCSLPSMLSLLSPLPSVMPSSQLSPSTSLPSLPSLLSTMPSSQMSMLSTLFPSLSSTLTSTSMSSSSSTNRPFQTPQPRPNLLTALRQNSFMTMFLGSIPLDPSILLHIREQYNETMPIDHAERMDEFFTNMSIRRTIALKENNRHFFLNQRQDTPSPNTHKPIPKNTQPFIDLRAHSDFKFYRIQLNADSLHQIYNWLTMYPPLDHSSNTYNKLIPLNYYHLTKRYYLLSHTIRCLNNISTPIAYVPIPNFILITSILYNCTSFAAIEDYFRSSDLPDSIQYLRENLHYLREIESGITVPEPDNDVWRFWKICNAVEVFLAIFVVLFDPDNALFEKLSPVERTKILRTLKTAFECTILFERMLCLFFLEHPDGSRGHIWATSDCSNPIDYVYVTMIEKYYPDLSYLLRTCKPVSLRIHETDSHLWIKNMQRLPGGTIGLFKQAVVSNCQ